VYLQNVLILTFRRDFENMIVLSIYESDLHKYPFSLVVVYNVKGF